MATMMLKVKMLENIMGVFEENDHTEKISYLRLASQCL